MIQRDLQGHMLGIDEKTERLQKQSELLVVGINKKNHKKEEEELYEMKRSIRRMFIQVLL